MNVSHGLKSFALSVLLCSSVMAGVTVERVTDINPGPGASNPRYLTAFNGKLYFVASDTDDNNKQLWCYDGQYTTKVSDLYINSLGVDARGIPVFNDALYFPASVEVGPEEKYELWKFDGQTASMVKDISSVDYGSRPNSFVTYGNELYFTARDDANNHAIYKYDGQDVSIVADSHSTGFAASGMVMRTPIVFNNEILFYSVDDRITFPDDYHGAELWKYDGQQVSMVMDINPGRNASKPERFTIFNDSLYFLAHGPQWYQFYQYDGTSVTPVTLATNHTYLTSPVVTVLGDYIYYEGYDGGVWRFDGIDAESVASFDDVGWIYAFDGRLYISGDDGHIGKELWVFDGESTSLVADIMPGDDLSGAGPFCEYQGELYFVAGDDVYGRELYKLVPEPSSWLLLACASAVIFKRRQRDH